MISKPTVRLWNSITPIFNAILNHPFIKGLTDGSLREEIFKNYVIQDAIYLVDYARALAILASKAPREEWIRTFAEDSLAIIEFEKSLHRSFFSMWGIKETDLVNVVPTPTTYAYVNHLLRNVILEDFPIGVAAILPCYWIYLEVGKALESKGSPNPTYAKWIEMYSSKEYSKYVERVINIADEVLSNIDEVTWLKAVKVFKTSSVYEYMFWDSTYRNEKFPFNLTDKT